MLKLIQYLQSGSLFPQRSYFSLASVRISLSLIMLFQLIGVFNFGLLTFMDHLLFFIVFMQTFFLLIGFLLPFTIVISLIFYANIAYYYSFWSLGTEAISWCLVALLIHGGNPSKLDRHLIEITNFTSRHLLKMYELWGKPSTTTLFLSRFISLFLFSLSAFYSVSLHGQDPYWAQGDLGKILLTSNYFSYFSDLYVKLFNSYEYIDYLISTSVRLFIPIFGLLLLLIFLRGTISKYVIKISLTGFFIFSILNLQLGVLPFVEMLLLLYWFTGSNRDKFKFNKKFFVLYDDYCNLCQKTRRIYGLLDTTKVIKWLPLSNSTELLEFYNLSVDEVTKDITMISGDGVFKGYDFYLITSKWIPSLLFVYPFLFIGKISGIGVKIYRFISLRRSRNKINCLLTPAKDLALIKTTTNEIQDFLQKKVRLNIVNKVFTIFICLLSFFYIVSSPVFQKSSNAVIFKNIVTDYSFIFRMFGLMPIDVFNSDDIDMLKNYVVYEAINPNSGKIEIIPIVNYDGSRGSYLLFDEVYFGFDLPLKRELSGLDLSVNKCDFVKYYIKDNQIFNKIFRSQKSKLIKITIFSDMLIKSSVKSNNAIVCQFYHYP
jgi:hypothetical protein